MSVSANGTERLRVVLRGAVQGVGFRPFVHRLATGLGLTGWVANSTEGLSIEVEGSADACERFLLRLPMEKPKRAAIHSLEPLWLDPCGLTQFEIRPSLPGPKTAVIQPDIATCDDCLADIMNPANPRYQYPFTTCTHCGPRFSIMESLPYDRSRTTMKTFRMCPACQAEYDDPSNRRFHAQPNACPACGPWLRLINGDGRPFAERSAALGLAIQALAAGQILAVKGLGGFHLCVDAQNDEAVRRLRERKARVEKPFALMVPDMKWARLLAQLSSIEERLMESAEAPIVLVSKMAEPDVSGWALSAAVAPGAPTLGLMLPYTPLHHLLLQAFPYPIVATSGNHREEPICIDEQAALVDLKGLADLFLVHNRPIARPVDDSIVRVVGGREMVIRRARGFAPLPVAAGADGATPVVGVGAHMKNAIAISVGDQVVLSQHIGDLETMRAMESFQSQIRHLTSLYDSSPAMVACDDHPDYLSTHYAHGTGLPRQSVQHHHAHVLSCLADNAVEPPALGVAWDGSGYGPDGTLWGGEFLAVDAGGYRRIAHLRPFRLPGAQSAAQEPRRSALGLLFEMEGGRCVERRDLAPIRACTDRELEVFTRMLEQKLQSPVTTSAGRLFDAVASLLGLRQALRYEGQAALELEWAAGRHAGDAFPFEVVERQGIGVLDWAPMIRELLRGLQDGAPVAVLSARFHATLAEMIAEIARRSGLSKVALSGGCFQNRRLTESAVERLRASGLRPYWHQRIPTNDGGIAVGQVRAAQYILHRRQENIHVSGNSRADYSYPNG